MIVRGLVAQVPHGKGTRTNGIMEHNLRKDPLGIIRRVKVQIGLLAARLTGMPPMIITALLNLLPGEVLGKIVSPITDMGTIINSKPRHPRAATAVVQGELGTETTNNGEEQITRTITHNGAALVIAPKATEEAMVEVLE